MEQSSNDNPSPIFVTYQSIIVTIFRSPAAWLFVALYVAAAIIEAFLLGASSLVKPLITLFVYILIILATIAFTQNAPPPIIQVEVSYSHRFLWWQFGIALLFCLLSASYSLLLFGPLQALVHYGGLFILGNILVLFLLSVIFPLIAMRLLKVPWSELGFGRGYRVLLIIGVSCLIPICLLIVQVITGRAIVNVLRESISFFLQAGFPEEVFYRGILLTRLIRLAGVKWGIVLTSLLFGLLHVAVNLFHSGSILVTLVEVILFQATFGIVVAILFVRTHNIWAGVVFHTLADATGW